MGSFCGAVAVVLIGVVAGLAIADWINAAAVESLPVPRSEVGAPESERSGQDLFGFIFRRNLTVFVTLLLGVVTAGLVTVVVLLGNGIAIGQLIGFATATGMSYATVANLILPHGVLELGTLCIAGAVGLRGIRLAFDLGGRGSEGSLDVDAGVGGEGPVSFGDGVRRLRLGLVLAFGVGALGLAAAIEAFVTIEIAESVRRGM